MARTLLALLLFCFVSLHAALPSAAAIDEPSTIVTVLPDDAIGTAEDETAPMSPDAATKCHDSCSWLAAWHAPVLREAHRSPPERYARPILSGLVSQVVPPPR
ncbi:hypothetical protein SAMN02982922_0238 [Mesorhizobium australicum]|uniref:Uncharacterized protein n=1 Tax=Mesorhizobium australicum TaxID=536018 RepID=A0A1X7MQ02_9HYPH|nr:hypothetical protein SAMN02982922_0238 [Mesorhizobium australicum]